MAVGRFLSKLIESSYKNMYNNGTIFTHYTISIIILIAIGVYFRRLSCWIILALTGLAIPLGLFIDAAANGMGEARNGLMADKQVLPFLIITVHYLYHDVNVWFWAIAGQFMVYGIGACFACSTKKWGRNVAIYIAAVAIIHVLASKYANYLAPGTAETF